jgi:hypothetical protein
MEIVKKSSVFEDISNSDKVYWRSKTPEERMNAALKLIQFAKKIYNANPNNKPLTNGNGILKSDSPIERRKR